MRITVGCDLTVACLQSTPLLLMVQPHTSRRGDLVSDDPLISQPAVPVTEFVDGFGNRCCRLVAPAGDTQLRLRALVECSGQPDPVLPHLSAVPVELLPPETYPFLRPSRYCETDRLDQTAWDLFGEIPAGWPLVQAICDWVHTRIHFDMGQARPTKTALEVLEEGQGVCRDFAHLAIAFCRSLNVPARYCTGYVGYTGVPRGPEPIDFSAWFEAYLEGGWHVFDARYNTPRIGRVLIGRGRDAGDVPFLHSFGPHDLNRFEVITQALAAV